MGEPTFAVGQRVVVIAAPPDVREDPEPRGQHLWYGQHGVITEICESCMSRREPKTTCYMVTLDEDLDEADDHGWVTNDYHMDAVALAPLSPTIRGGCLHA